MIRLLGTLALASLTWLSALCLLASFFVLSGPGMFWYGLMTLVFGVGTKVSYRGL